MIIKLLIEGGDMKPGPAVAQQLGPMGVNMGKVMSDVNEATKEFKGMKVPVELDIDEKTKEFKVSTSSPPTSELLKKELNLEKGSGKISEEKVGNLAIEDVIKVAKVKHSNMLEKDLKAAVKSVLGTCASVGIMVETDNANDLIQKIGTGKFETEIEQGKTEVTTEKREILKRQFEEIKSAQEAKAAEAAKEAEEAEAAKAEAAPAEGEAPAEGAPTDGEDKPEEKKEEPTE
ncbi:50S ribosomal protein L11 [Candidatus Woesearchaeota archaeon]|jgi:large subunit ribosomal protein L11|nr:50S ribosomal protein L11 [Candidatus Woesearchaeota archaeon]